MANEFDLMHKVERMVISECAECRQSEMEKRQPLHLGMTAHKGKAGIGLLRQIGLTALNLEKEK